MRTPKWTMCDVTRLDRIRNLCSRENLEIRWTQGGEIRENRLKRFGYVLREETIARHTRDRGEIKIDRIAKEKLDGGYQVRRVDEAPQQGRIYGREAKKASAPPPEILEKFFEPHPNISIFRRI